VAHGTANVLLVDDEEVVLKIGQELLEAMAFLLQLRGGRWPQTRINKGSGFGNVQNVVPQKACSNVDI
jgi:hypothetical protein